MISSLWAAWHLPLFRRRDLCHAAMARLAAQPAEKGSLEQLGIEPIRLRPAMLARYGNTCRVDHISLDAASPQPPRQPEAVPAGFVGHRDPIDRAACLGRFVPPAIQQLEQRRLIGRKFLQRLSVDPRNYAGDQPGRSAHLNDGDECAILIHSGERAAQVIRLLHGAPRRLLPATMMPCPRRSPHSISGSPLSRGRRKFAVPSERGYRSEMGTTYANLRNQVLAFARAGRAGPRLGL